jgi:hypothetical protein
MTKPQPATPQRSEQAAEKRTRRPGQTLACGWCGGPISLAATGRTPKWCSDTCRHRAWETTRAAATGAVAVKVVNRIVEVDKPLTVVEHVEVPALPKGVGWAGALHELARQIGTGKVYDRDLPALASALEQVITALNRRPALRRFRPDVS